MKQPVRYHTGKFPPKKLDLDRLVRLIGDAREALGRYDGLLSAIPNSAVMLSPLTTQEAVLSSRIEGTQATMGDVLGHEAGAIDESLDERKRGDIQEVINYRKAMWQAVELLNELPLCQPSRDLRVRGVANRHGGQRTLLTLTRERQTGSSIVNRQM